MTAPTDTLTTALPATVRTELCRLAEQFAAFGQPQVAAAVEETLRRVETALAAWWNEALSLRDAAAWGGYSESQLRRLTKDGTVPVAPDGGIRRRHVPVHAGHELPLGLEPVPVAREDWTENLRVRRQQRSNP